MDEEPDATLSAALKRCAALEWPLEPLPSESAVHQAVQAAVAQNQLDYPARAARLLAEAHACVHAVDARAFPVWIPHYEWDDVCEAAFCLLVHARLRLTECLDAVQGVCCAITGEGLMPPPAPLIGHRRATSAYAALETQAQFAGYAGTPASERWTAVVHAYTALLCYVQHARIGLSPIDQRVKRLEDQLRQQQEGRERL